MKDVKIDSIKGKERIEQLEKRAKFLKERIEHSDKDLSWDKQEYTALIWILNKIKGEVSNEGLR